MLRSEVESSPALYARIGGALSLVNIALGFFGVFVRGRIVVGRDAAATAANLRSMESLWRLGIAAELVALVCGVALATIYFVLLKPVSRELNLLATFLRLLSFAIEAVAALGLCAALFPLGDPPYLGAFTHDQRAAFRILAITC